MPNNIRQQGHWISTGNPETVDDVTPYAPGMLGAKVTVKQPSGPGTPGTEEYRHKTYRYVQTDSTMTVAPYKGAVAYWANAASYLVTTTVSGRRGRPAGIFQNAVVPGHYCFIQTNGPATVKFIDAVTAQPTTAGLIVIPSATNAKADCLAAGSAATYPPLGMSAGTYDVLNAECTVELDIPESVD